jgi:Uncharacterised protein family UPF0547
MGAIGAPELLILVLVIIPFLVCGLVGGRIWQSKGGSYGAGFALGALLGLIGILYVGFATPKGGQPPAQASPSPSINSANVRATKRCPRCAEDVLEEAKVCRFCGHEFPEPAPLAEAAVGSYDGELRDTKEHAYDVEWAKTADGRVVYREKSAQSWTLYDPRTTALMPPAEYR